MDFNSEMDERYRKSVLVTVCTDDQIIGGEYECSLALGEATYKSGTAIVPTATWHEIRRRGLYRADANVAFIPVENGKVTTRMLLDGKELPASHVTIYVQAGHAYNIPSCVPAFDRSIGTSETPRLELAIEGVTGNVVRTMLSTTKLA